MFEVVSYFGHDSKEGNFCLTRRNSAILTSDSRTLANHLTGPNLYEPSRLGMPLPPVQGSSTAWLLSKELSGLGCGILRRPSRSPRAGLWAIPCNGPLPHLDSR